MNAAMIFLCYWGSSTERVCSPCWLTHILSQVDHRLNHVESYAEKQLHTLHGCAGRQIRPLDVSDDR